MGCDGPSGLQLALLTGVERFEKEEMEGDILRSLLAPTFDQKMVSVAEDGTLYDASLRSDFDDCRRLSSVSKS